jgi:uncharacterized protein (DUF488 family)
VAGVVYSIGHSSRTLDELRELLARHEVVGIADVRRYPRSRRHPHFDAEVLAAELPAYLHLPSLGGRRRPVPGSVNDGWEVEAFRGYADHMATGEFAAGLAELTAFAARQPTAVMCAEAPWWRCHRRLVCDALLVRGWTVRHILPDGALADHELPPFAVVEGTAITYPAAQLRL